jgi:TetR/AcrR family transcriptional regulator, mexJK operon transcriptional repressor
LDESKPDGFFIMTAPGVKAPISRDPAIVRARILDAAQAEFMAEGFAGASTNRILEGFGGSKPTMFRHFPTKRALFEGVVARIADRWSQAIDWQAIAEPDPQGWLTAFLIQTANWILGDDNIFVGRMAIAEGHAFPEVGAVYRARALEPLERVLADKLGAWGASGDLLSSHPEQDAAALFDLTLAGLVNRRLYRLGDTPGPRELADYMEQRVGLFLYGRGR